MGREVYDNVPLIIIQRDSDADTPTFRQIRIGNINVVLDQCLRRSCIDSMGDGVLSPSLMEFCRVLGASEVGR